MGFLKKHGEKILLVLLIAGVAVSVGLGLTSLSSLEHPRTLRLTTPPPDVSLDVEGLDATLVRLSGEPPTLKVNVDTFTPESRVNCMNASCRSLIPADASTCVYCGEKQEVIDRDTDGDGIVDKQEVAWGMDPNNPEDVYLDPDGDGFPTLYEFQEGTDPTLASSRPDLIEFVRIQDYNETKIDFELRGTARFGDAWTLQLFWKYPDEDRGNTQFIKTGRRFGRNNEFLAESFTERTKFIDGKNIDQSQAVIRSGRHELKLGRNQDNRSGAITESSAVIGTIFGPDWEQEVRMDESFELGTKSYMIVDIRRDAVVLQPDADSESPPDPIVIVKTTLEDEKALEQYEPNPGDATNPPSGGPSGQPSLQDLF